MRLWFFQGNLKAQQRDFMAINIKNILKFIAAATCFEAIVGFIVIIILIAGVVTIMSKTAYNLFLSIPACILIVFVVMYVYWKIVKKVMYYFELKDKQRNCLVSFLHRTPISAGRLSGKGHCATSCI